MRVRLSGITLHLKRLVSRQNIVDGDVECRVSRMLSRPCPSPPPTVTMAQSASRAGFTGQLPMTGQNRSSAATAKSSNNRGGNAGAFAERRFGSLVFGSKNYFYSRPALEAHPANKFLTI